MSTHARNIKEGIQRLAGTFGKDYLTTVDCVVLSVDEQKRTCAVEPVSTTALTSFSEVYLSATPNDGLICYPEIGSTVRIALNNKGDKYVLQFGDLQKIRITTGQMEVIVQDGEVLLGDGSFGGLIKIDDLKTQIDNMLTAIKLACNAGFYALYPLDAGASYTAFVSASESIQNLNKTTLENTTIKHGI